MQQAVIGATTGMYDAPSGVVAFAPAPAPVLKLPPMAPLPVKPINPLFVAPVDTPAPPVSGGSGCGGGGCPLAQPPAGGGSVTITKVSPAPAVLKADLAPMPTASGSSPMAGIPWWVWLLIALVILAVLK